MRRLASLLLILLASVAVGRSEPAYLDADRPVDERVDDLIARMTLDEKVGQMTQIDLGRLMGQGPWDRGPLNDAWLERVLGDAQVGSLLSGGNAAPLPADPRGWARTIDALQRYALDRSRLGIPILYGVDAIHGHAAVAGATVYPHALGLAATFDPELVARIGRAVGEDLAATGVSWNFAPVADLGRDPRWGRTYETFGESPVLAGALAAAYVRGQSDVPRVATTLKHFVGYGQAENGNDRAPAEIPLRTLRDTHLPPFAAGVRAGARTIMVNSGSVNGVPVHASRYLLTDVLRGEMGFGGIVLSDWADVEKLVSVHRVAEDASAAAATAVGAGVDVVMVPHDAAGFTEALLTAVEDGRLSEARIDEAVRRVLTLKFALGLFEAPYVDPAAADAVIGRGRSLARRAARESLTLLENRRGALPLREVDRVLVTGPGATDVAMQMGGWTLGWQGLAPGGEAPPAVTVLEGLRQGAPAGVEVVHRDGDAADLAEAARAADAVIVVLGEAPYAETPGDRDAPALPTAQVELVDALSGALREDGDTALIAVLLAGRPLSLPEGLLDAADALLMAHLPGTEAGGAVADVLHGAVSPSGRLPFTWPAAVGQVPIAHDDRPAEARDEPLYPFGHGLSYTRFRYADLQARADAEGVRLSVTVENVGDVEADEVVLAYARFPVLPVMAPERRLVGFERVTLAPGASRRVEVRIPSGRLGLVPGDVPGDQPLAVLAGDYRFEVGGVGVDVALEGRVVSSTISP